MNNKVDIELLKELQHQMKWEDEHDNDSQASPRFWTIMDYKYEVGDEDYHNGKFSYFYNDGDIVEFDTIEELKEFIAEIELGEDDEDLQNLLEDEYIDFEVLWDYIVTFYEDEPFDLCFMREVSYIASNTMFLTKEEAKKHLELNRHHYSSKAHTYAMTAWRAPKVENALKFLMSVDLDKISFNE